MKMQRSNEWLKTSQNEPRGYIQPQSLEELWFHAGTNCNLRCPFCLEGSKPGDNRLEFLTLDDAQRFVNEALEFGVKKFSFTGGEPFVNPEFIPILEAALEHRPCLVLTNATEPLMNQMGDILPLQNKPNLLSFRVSLDHPDPVKHDESRGRGNFRKALDTLGRLPREGFGVSIARLMLPGEDSAAVDKAYAPYFEKAGVPADLTIIKFPEFHLPGSLPQVAEITEDCMTRYLSAEKRAAFMCNFSKMVVRKNGQCGVYACTLVDDVENYDLGKTLREAMEQRVLLGHHRCYSCFAGGASCSEGV
ncbi:MAG: radical SAM protein [Deltaproteobacteria bacterium]|nr:MAG: radical SAM protein [Deltaproteobacteria bacterium]